MLGCVIVTSFLILPIVWSAVPCTKNGSVYVDENDVNRYYRCDYGIQSQHLCPPGTTFDVNQLACTDVNSKVVRTKRSIEKDQLRIVCYYINWGIYRGGIGKFTPEDIDPFLCTHIIYAFAKLDETTYEIAPADPWADISLSSYKKVVGVKEKNPKLRVLLAIGGWIESKGNKYSTLASDSQLRKKFIKQAVSFLKLHGFDGLDLDWEFPVCWQADCSKGPESDKENFSEFVKELRKAFDNEKPRLLLSAAVSPSNYIANISYDAKSLGKNLDFLNVMAYHYPSANDGETVHHAAFRIPKKGSNDSSNVVGSMKYWEEHGVPKHKLVLGIPAFGRSFKLANANEHGLHARTVGEGEAGIVSQQPGSLTYSEILDKIENRGWKVERDADAGPYAFGEGQWVGYDDPVSCKEKARFVRNNGYGGVMMWELAADDFNATWGNKRYPLLRSLKEGLENGGNGLIKKENNIIYACIAILLTSSFMKGSISV